MNYDESDAVDLYMMNELEKSLQDKKLYELVDLWNADQPHTGRLSMLKLALMRVMRYKTNRPFVVEWTPDAKSIERSVHYLTSEVVVAAEAERKQELEQTK